MTEGSSVGDKVRGGAGARSVPQPGGCWSSKRSRAVVCPPRFSPRHYRHPGGVQKAARGPPRENPPPCTARLQKSHDSLSSGCLHGRSTPKNGSTDRKGYTAGRVITHGQRALQGGFAKVPSSPAACTASSSPLHLILKTGISGATSSAQ